MTAAIWRAAASWWRQTAQTIRTPCLLAGWNAAHCKIRLQTFRGAGGGTAPAPGRVGVAGASARAWIGPGSAAYRWLALGGQLGRARRLDGRGPAAASRSSGVTRPGPRCRGSLQQPRPPGWLELCRLAPDRGLACRPAGNWQKMAHASSTQASCRE